MTPEQRQAEKVSPTTGDGLVRLALAVEKGCERIATAILQLAARQR